MSKTKENLRAAFAGESQARNKYTFFAAVARKEGYHFIAKLFEETAENEKRHAKDHYMLFEGLGDTADCLKKAIAGEDHETRNMYVEFAEQAEKDGESKAANLFRLIGQIEGHHRDRYRKLLEMVEKGTVYKRDKSIKWKCSVCGHIHEGEEPPARCPTCGHSREHFEPANMDI